MHRNALTVEVYVWLWITKHIVLCCFERKVSFCDWSWHFSQKYACNTSLSFPFTYRFFIDFAALIDGRGFFLCGAFWDLLPLSQSLEQKIRNSSEKLEPHDHVWRGEIHLRSISVGICYELLLYYCIWFVAWYEIWTSLTTGKYQAASDWSCDLNMSATNEVTCFE